MQKAIIRLRGVAEMVKDAGCGDGKECRSDRER